MDPNNILDPYMITYSNKHVHYLNPQEDQIEIEDIAHHLSLICRFGGACKKHYSVAQHCILLSQIMKMYFGVRLAFEALMHDAEEAYTQDMVNPLKRILPEFQSVGKRLYKCIASKFGMPSEVNPVIYHWDKALFVAEYRSLMPKGYDPPAHLREFPQDLWDMPIHPYGSPEEAEYLFLKRFRDLHNKYKEETKNLTPIELEVAS